MAYDNTNTGALFGNTKKRDGEKDPDLQGKLNIAGTEHWISAWFFTYEKDGKTKKAIRIKIGDEIETEKPKPSKPSSQPAFDDMEDEIPF